MPLVKTNWLNAATTPGTETDPEEITGATRFGLQVETAGSPTTVGVFLDGSIDGVNWHPLIVATGVTGQLYGFGLAATAPVVKYIKLRLDALTGGTSPTVTASVVAV